MRRQHAGFTLLELMIAITIMGTMAALLAPGIGEFMADARAAGASEDLVRLSRHVRARAQETGLAHLLVYTGIPGDAGGLGRIRVYEGMNNHCRQTPWPQTVGGTAADGHAPVDVLDLSSSSYNPVSNPTIDDANRQVIALRVANAIGAPDSAVVCYEPSGATWQGTFTASSIGFAFTRQIAPITFTITRRVSGVTRGADRNVVFQPGGIARFRY
jgi:prepilin-type N-terminal cleavage/methylation domain-containing protein